MPRLLTLLIGLIFFALLSYVCVSDKAPAMQMDILSRVNNSLQKKGLVNVNAIADGRDITLNGSVALPEARIKAERASELEGVRIVHNQVSVSSPDLAADYFLTIRKAQNKLSLSGFVPDVKVQHELVTRSLETMPGIQISDTLKQRADSPEDWSRITKIALKGLKDCQNGELNISHKKIFFAAEVASEEEKTKLYEGMIDGLPTGFQKTISINITEAPISGLGLRDSVVQTGNSMTDKTKSTEQRKDCQIALNNALASKMIRFTTGSKNLDPTAYSLLDEIYAIANRCHNQRFHIIGHTDSIGSASVNQRLSGERAEAVKNYLVNMGMEPVKFKLTGAGASSPIADNATKAGRQLNRRIEIIVEGES